MILGEEDLIIYSRQRTNMDAPIHSVRQLTSPEIAELLLNVTRLLLATHLERSWEVLTAINGTVDEANGKGY